MEVVTLQDQIAAGAAAWHSATLPLRCTSFDKSKLLVRLRDAQGQLLRIRCSPLHFHYLRGEWKVGEQVYPRPVEVHWHVDPSILAAVTDLPEDAQRLIIEARTSRSFHDDHCDHITGTGERSVDFLEYTFELADGRNLQIQFEEFSYTSHHFAPIVDGQEA